MKKNKIKTMHRADNPPPMLLIAEDDPDDRLIIKEALVESAWSPEHRFVNDGEELMHVLLSGLKAKKGTAYPLPALILLDLNLPKKDGREALSEIKAHPLLRAIPIVVLTTSKDQVDIVHSYDVGANSYIVKPADFNSLLDIMRTLKKYWFDVTRLP